MKRILFFLLLLPMLTYAQLYTYLPNGTPIKFKKLSIAQTLDSLHAGITDVDAQPLGMVYFKKLTNIPVLILFTKKDYPASIPKMVASYDYQSYLNSYSYYYDLKSMIKDSTLTKSYLTNVFGVPDKIGAATDTTDEFYTFRKHNVSVRFKGEYATSVDVTNFLAMKKHGLILHNYDVVGEDYTIGFEASVSNLSLKTIKYLFFTVVAQNPVHDLIATKTVRCIGPIRPDDSGTYEFKDLIYTRTGKYLNLTQLKIQYMDGTVKTLNRNQINSIKIHDWEAEGNETID
jgi:hypothetical protein